MHERCKKDGNNFPLISYMVPIREEKKILTPSSITIRITNEKSLKINDVGFVVVGQVNTEGINSDNKKHKKKQRNESYNLDFSFYLLCTGERDA